MSHGLILFFLIPSLTAIGFWLTALAAARAFAAQRPPPPDPAWAPPVSLLIPVHGLDPGGEAALASFCRQDYPAYQLLFGVRRAEDPLVETLRRLGQACPAVDLQIVVCAERLGINPKVSNLIQMARAARHAFLLVADGDIRVAPDYLRRVVQPMRDEAVGVVTCLCRAARGRGWLGTLEALRESTEFGPSVLVARWLEGMRFALGSTMLVRRRALEAIGGFPAIADYLADDFAMGAQIARAGWQVVLSDVIVEHAFALTSWRQLVRRQLRWNRGIRASRPWGYRGLIFTYGIPMSLGLLLAARGALWTWGVTGLVVLTRLAAAYGIGAGVLRDEVARRRWLWVPVHDLVSGALWAAGLVGSRVAWREHQLQLVADGKVVPVAG